MKRLFVTGIGTGIGKTVVAAILAEALEADYWKPVQAGSLGFTDTMTVKELISNPKSVFHKETYRLSEPMSPHAAAAIDGVEIKVSELECPETENHIVIEGAGGMLVPLNEKELVVDMIAPLECEVVLVSRNYLGSINHTLLSIEALKSRQLPVAGIVFNGETTKTTEDFILNHSGLPCIGRINEEEGITKEVVSRYAELFSKTL